MRNKEVYLDAAANTYLDKKVYKAMKPYLNEKYMGNSFAIHHYGNRAMKAVEEARQKAADVLKVKNTQIIFTSGASEGNNTVIKAVALDILKHKLKKIILCSALEHSSVYNTCKQVESWGVPVEYIYPNKNGLFPQYVLRQKINKRVALVCMMAINNEIGVENDINYIINKAHKVKSLVLTDCTQSIEYGKGSINIGEIYPDFDFITFSGHKIYGPTGTGCLIYKESLKYFLNNKLITAGSQEYGLRGGTTNVAGVVGLSKAIELMDQELYGYKYEVLFSYLCFKLGEYGKLNAIPCHKNISSWDLSKTFNSDNLAAELATYGIAVSSGSACDTEHDETKGEFNGSHVLKALKLSEKEIKNTIRISFSKKTTKRDIDLLADALKKLKKQKMELENAKN